MMKHKTFSFLLTMLMSMVACVASAHNFVVNGIYYNITSSTEFTVSVTYEGNSYSSYSNEYTGSVVIPETVTYNGKTYSVTSIGESAFNDCSGLTSVTIPNSVTSISGAAFRDCSGLTSVTIPNSVASIGESAFYGCRGLTSVTIPESVTSISSGAFHLCSGLTSVTIPNSVTSIGDYAFSYCSGLTSVTIPNSVTSIGVNPFVSCSGLTSIIVEDGNSKYDSRDGCNAIIESSSNTLVAGCKNTAIPNNVTSIGSSAFSYCSGLTSVTIPESVTSISSGAFSGCSNLITVTINSNSFISTNFSYDSSLGVVFGWQVKEYILGDGVVSIGGYAFRGCSGLTSVTIPNSVNSIGYSAFSGCSGLTSVTIPNSVTSIDGAAFSGCSGLTSVTIPNSVTSIGSSAFRDCSGLTSVTIGNSVTAIGWYAFFECSGLTRAEFANVESLCNIKFSDFTSNPLSYAHHLYINGEEVTDLVIPNSLTSIGNYAFYGCSGLTSVTIPSSVTSIGQQAFSGCKNLTSITSYMTLPPIIENTTFPSSFKTGGTLYIPAGTRSLYVEKGWSLYFANIVEMEAGDPIWLSIMDASNGQSELKCKAGEVYTFRFKPVDNWHVHSVVFNDKDVTDELTADNEFTTPAMSESATIIVNYAAGSTSVKSVSQESEIRVLSLGEEIIVKNAPEGTPIRIYSLSGKLLRMVYSSYNETRINTQSLQEELLIVKVGEKSVKVMK